MTSSFICSTCGVTHEGLPTDYGWKLPDVVWAIPESERADRARFNGDLCEFGDRFFIRCVLTLPFLDQPGGYGWGLWVELSKSDFARYVELYDKDGSDEPAVPGVIANAISAYTFTLGLPVQVQFQGSSSRPILLVSLETRHPLASEQVLGLDDARYHEILVSIGAISAH